MSTKFQTLCRVPGLGANITKLLFVFYREGNFTCVGFSDQKCQPIKRSEPSTLLLAKHTPSHLANQSDTSFYSCATCWLNECNNKGEIPCSGANDKHGTIKS